MANTYSSTTAIRPTVTGTKTANSITSPYTSASPLQRNTTATSNTASSALRTPMTGSTSTAYTPNATSTAANSTSASVSRARQGAAGLTAVPTVNSTSNSTSGTASRARQGAAAVSTNQNPKEAAQAARDAALGYSSAADPTNSGGGIQNFIDEYRSQYPELGYDYLYGGTAQEEVVPEVAPNALSQEAADRIKEQLTAYNTDREQKIRDMYAGNINAQNAAQKTAYDASANALKTAYDTNLNNLRTAYDNNTASLRTAYDTNLAQIANTYQQNLSDAQAYRDNISPQYQQSMNALGAEYERQRRNNNMQAALNGLNTGAGSQLALGQSMAYQANQGNLARSENEALNEAERGIYNLNRDFRNRQDILNTEYANNLDKLNREYANQQNTYGTTYQNEFAALQTNYQNKIAEAAANNDYQMAAALLDEYGAQYDRMMQQAEQLAQFGDFSMFANIYGIEAAQQMEKNWAFQNPDLAYNLGRITAEEYQAITGMLPAGYGGGYGGAGGSISNSSSSSSYGRQKYIEDLMAKAKQTGQIAALVGSGGNYVPKEFDAGAYGSTKFYGIPSKNNASSGNNTKERERVALKTYNSQR